LKRFAWLIGVTLLVMAAGCKPAPSETDDTPPKPAAVAFEGTVDPKFVGTWKTAKETSCLDLRKDGSAQILSAHPSPRGIVKSTLEGSWLVSGGDLLLRYTVPHQTETIVKYPATLSGNKMILVQGSKSKESYTRS